mmetsp:Transcript_34998/g.57157  ORF Transcript_34998/g.57157 Transcript_34998/m.57157 type:complete len:468 (-) Transcript_34998:162-1565(-)
MELSFPQRKQQGQQCEDAAAAAQSIQHFIQLLQHQQQPTHQYYHPQHQYQPVQQPNEPPQQHVQPAIVPIIIPPQLTQLQPNQNTNTRTNTEHDNHDDHEGHDKGLATLEDKFAQLSEKLDRFVSSFNDEEEEEEEESIHFAHHNNNRQHKKRKQNPRREPFKKDYLELLYHCIDLQTGGRINLERETSLSPVVIKTGLTYWTQQKLLAPHGHSGHTLTEQLKQDQINLNAKLVQKLRNQFGPFVWEQEEADISSDDQDLIDEFRLSPITTTRGNQSKRKARSGKRTLAQLNEDTTHVDKQEKQPEPEPETKTRPVKRAKTDQAVDAQTADSVEAKRVLQHLLQHDLIDKQELLNRLLNDPSCHVGNQDWPGQRNTNTMSSCDQSNNQDQISNPNHNHNHNHTHVAPQQQPHEKPTTNVLSTPETQSHQLPHIQSSQLAPNAPTTMTQQQRKPTQKLKKPTNARKQK